MEDVASPQIQRDVSQDLHLLATCTNNYHKFEMSVHTTMLYPKITKPLL